jgi:lincosamide nucleotidyltransferase A/C/D/E
MGWSPHPPTDELKAGPDLSEAVSRPAEAHDVLAVVHALIQADVPCWLDGGWGVDALLERQTRTHEDLDLVIALDRSEAAISALAAIGFRVSVDERPTRLLIAMPGGISIDLHTVTFDAEGGGVQQLQDGGTYRYPPSGFASHGLVGGTDLPCISAETQIECHLGYVPDAEDRHDVELLAKHFGLPLPTAYAGVQPSDRDQCVGARFPIPHRRSRRTQGRASS